MKKIANITLKLIALNNCIAGYYAEKKQLEKELKAEYERIMEICGKKGITPDELDELEELEGK